MHEVAVDLHDVARTPRGKRVLQAFATSNVRFFQTARGHLAAHVKQDALDRIVTSLSLARRDGDDGLIALCFAERT